MPPDLTFLPTLIGSNYPCLELIFMEPACSSHWSSTVSSFVQTQEWLQEMPISISETEDNNFDQ